MVQPLDLKLQTSLNPLDTEDSHLRPARTAAEETPIPTCSAQPIVDYNHFLSAQARGGRSELRHNQAAIMPCCAIERATP